MKVISIDYDDTYTEDPELFEAFIQLAKSRGHVVVMCTGRNWGMKVPVSSCEVFYTGGLPKAEFMKSQGLEVDIWVDDWPEIIGVTR